MNMLGGKKYELFKSTNRTVESIRQKGLYYRWIWGSDLLGGNKNETERIIKNYWIT